MEEVKKQNAKTIETETSDAILQTPEEVTIGEKIYSVQPPSVATLILVSEAVSRLPHFDSTQENVLEQSLALAKDCEPLGEIAAILILGARGLKETVTEATDGERKGLRSLIPFLNGKAVTTREIDRKAELTRELLETQSPRELFNLTARLLKRMQIADFFGLTTFLTEINLLRQTKVEEEES